MKPTVPENSTKMDIAISDAEHIAETFQALGLTQDPINPRILLWLGEQLSGACERMRDVFDGDGLAASSQ